MTLLALRALLARVPWQAWALLGLLALLLLLRSHWIHVGAQGVQARWDAEKAANQLIVDKAIADKKATEARQGDLIAKATDQLNMENANAQADLRRTIADLRRGQLRLRDRFTCKGTVPGAPASAEGSDAAGQGGFSVETQESILRIGADADAIAHRLTACQAIIAADRQ